MNSVLFSKLKPTLSFIVLTIVIFILTQNPFTSSFSLQMTLASLLFFIVYVYFARKKESITDQIKTFTFFLTAVIVFLVASTGWFFSPFFFTFYLLGIILGFVFTPSVSLGFIATLVGLFSVNVGEVDIAYDFLIILSLLLVIPLTFYLKREYLRLKEAEKDILVLEKKQEKYKDKVEEILVNKVNNFAVNLRQPINDIKQLAYRLAKLKEKEKINKNRQRIIASSEEALRLLKNFEESATGKKLLTTPENL